MTIDRKNTYILFCSLFCIPYRLLTEKRKEIGDEVNKLRNGLFKIDDTRATVEAMSIQLEVDKTKVILISHHNDYVSTR